MRAAHGGGHCSTGVGRRMQHKICELALVQLDCRQCNSAQGWSFCNFVYMHQIFKSKQKHIHNFILKMILHFAPPKFAQFGTLSHAAGLLFTPLLLYVNQLLHNRTGSLMKSYDLHYATALLCNKFKYSKH